MGSTYLSWQCCLASRRPTFPRGFSTAFQQTSFAPWSGRIHHEVNITRYLHYGILKIIYRFFTIDSWRALRAVYVMLNYLQSSLQDGCNVS